MAPAATARSRPAPRGRRPPISVIVPFAGDLPEAERLLEAVGRLRLRPDDEVVVVDNSRGQVVPRRSDGRVTVIAAEDMRSSYYARNVGAERAVNQWFLFFDADCLPRPDLLDAYFASPVGSDMGAVAGEVEGVPDQPGLIPRYARSRGHLRQKEILEHAHGPMAVTANMLVRREAWLSVGGFHEGIRSTGDLDFSWRLQDAGWKLGYAPTAVVDHLHRTTLTGLARQFARYGAGTAWAARRHPGYGLKSVPRELARALAGIVVWTLVGQFERAAFKAIDGVVVAAGAAGWLMGNVASAEVSRARPPARPGQVQLVAFVDLFPELTETFVLSQIRALEAGGHRIRVEAGARALRPSWPSARGISVRFLEDDGVLPKALGLCWLWLHHPRGCVRDLRARRRWRREEDAWPLRSLAPVARRLARGGERHIHAYFAASAALNAHRLAQILGVPYSLTAYAYDVFRSPTNLTEKLQHSAFAVAISEHTAAHLRTLVSPEHRKRIHTIAMGVDAARFRRQRPYPGSRVVLAVGRLVEKKGFAYLVEAAGMLSGREAIDVVRIVGEGPERAALEQLAQKLGLGSTLQLLGARRPEEIRGLMEEADLLAAPCVIAADGDRDVLPAVVSEGLAMELPVVATDVASLPEVVRPQWGRIVPSRDAPALAQAIEEVLALPVEERREMGGRARAWVAANRDPASEAAKLAGLVASVQAGPRTTNRGLAAILDRCASRLRRTNGGA